VTTVKIVTVNGVAATVAAAAANPALTVSIGVSVAGATADAPGITLVAGGLIANIFPPVAITLAQAHFVAFRAPIHPRLGMDNPDSGSDTMGNVSSGGLVMTLGLPEDETLSAGGSDSGSLRMGQ
jgi:hypothetical protein